MKKILLFFALAGVITACGNGVESTAESDSDTANVTSTTPPPTADTASPIGVMMGDTSTAVYDSVKGGED